LEVAPPRLSFAGGGDRGTGFGRSSVDNWGLGSISAWVAFVVTAMCVVTAEILVWPGSSGAPGDAIRDGAVRPLLLVVALIFLSAGFVKGAIGLGLPTISMGLLATMMAPDRALAIVILPALVSNFWQAFGGGYLVKIVSRFWPLMLCAVLGSLWNAGAMTGTYAKYGSVGLGLLLMAYAGISLRQVRLRFDRRHEKWIGAVVGLVTGVVSASTGVQVMPSVPYLQATGMEKEELIQAMGVFFTVATLALSVNVRASGLATLTNAMPVAVAFICTFAGIFIGQAVRSKMPTEVFRRWFLVGVVCLGAYLAAAAVYELV